MCHIWEKIERWRWIHPLPTNPHKGSLLINDKQKRCKRKTCHLFRRNFVKNQFTCGFTSRFSKPYVHKQNNTTSVKPNGCYCVTLRGEQQKHKNYKLANSIKEDHFDGFKCCFTTSCLKGHRKNAKFKNIVHMPIC